MQPIASLVSFLTFSAMAAAPVWAQWTATSLSQPRTNIGSVVVGDLALFAGGNQGATYYADVDIYDAGTDSWSNTSVSVPRTLVAATAVGGLALFAGGLGATGATDVVDVFDTQTMTWRPTASLSQARLGVAATTVGNKALFVGGSIPGVGGVQATVDVYDASLGVPDDPRAWSVASLSLARSQITAVTVGDLAIFAGGNGPQGVPYDRVDIYDGSTGLWSQATLSVARTLGANAAAAVGTRAYFAGGHNSFQGGPGMYDVVDIYDAATGLWSTASLSLARGYLGATAVGNTVFFAGGAGQGFAYSDVVDVLNVGTGQWDSTALLSQARSHLSAVTVGDKAIFAAGGLQGTVSAVVDIYEPIGVNYCAATVNSTGSAATIAASGNTSLAANDLVLSANGVPNTPFLFFHGSTQTQVPFANGYRCTGGGVIRIGPLGLASGGVAQTTVNLVAAGITTPGQRNFQCWFRDGAGGGAGTNTSDAIAITFAP